MDDQQMSKKERRELRRQERQTEAAGQRRSNTARRLGIWGAVLVVLGVVIYLIAQYGDPATQSAGTLSVPVGEQDWSKANTASEIILVEYGDFQCPACGAYYPLIEKLVKDNGQNFKFVYRHYPLKNIHPNAEGASLASEAAGKQGKFWEMYGKLYQNQRNWSSLSRAAAKEKFVSYAKELSLDENKFSADMDSGELKDKVNSQLESATASGANSTPTFYLNGQKITTAPNSYDGFVELISAATANASPSVNP